MILTRFEQKIKILIFQFFHQFYTDFRKFTSSEKSEVFLSKIPFRVKERGAAGREDTKGNFRGSGLPSGRQLPRIILTSFFAGSLVKLGLCH